ncbi:MAG: polysaccharide biosynthesis/export family protein [Kiloniellales bacterium]|nr:polysaccharide biosynthesis/export family protein [Kiloniellales bacterium]
MLGMKVKALVVSGLLVTAGCSGSPYLTEPPTSGAAQSGVQSAAAFGSDFLDSGHGGADGFGTPQPEGFGVAGGALDQAHFLGRETQVAFRQIAQRKPDAPVRPVAPSDGQPDLLPGFSRGALGADSFIRAGDSIEVRFYRNTAIEGERYGIEVGDVLRVDVVDHIDVSRERVLVLPDGHISLPLVGSIRAAGKDVDQLSQELAARFESERILDPQVSVAVEESDKRLNALLSLEGGGGPASLTIAVTEESILALPFIPPLNANKPMSELLQDIRGAYWEKFGGRLEVTANLVERTGAPLVYVMGEVRQPTVVAHNRALNPIMAVAASGGFLPTGEPEDVRVIRTDRGGNYKVYAFDLEAELNGETQAAANFLLQPQDVVYVRPSGIAEANRWVAQYILNMLPFDLGASISYEPFASD